MAARSEAIPYDRLYHFIGAGLWDSSRLEATLWRQADELVGGAKAWLIIDDTALPKKGKVSVGVVPQYATVLGKNANCQTLVSMTLASSEVPIMLSLTTPFHSTALGVKVAAYAHDVGEFTAEHDIKCTRSGRGVVACLDPGVAALGFGKDDPKCLVNAHQVGPGPVLQPSSADKSAPAYRAASLPVRR